MPSLPKHRKCSIVSCNNKHYARDYCHAHYIRLMRYGSVVRQSNQRSYVLTNKGRAAVGLPLREEVSCEP